MQWRCNRIVAITVQTADRPQCHRMGSGHQATMNRAQPAVVAECQMAFVASNAGHRKDEKLSAEQRVDDAQMEQKDIVGAHLEKSREGNFQINYVYCGEH